MIDFENYERVTKKDEWGTALKDVDMGAICTVICQKSSK